MRLVSRKIWRAFAELDQYDDDTCARCLRRVWENSRSGQFWIMIFPTLLVSWLVWIIVMIVVAEVFDLGVFPRLSAVLHLMLAGFVIMPLLAGILVRDLWLSKQLLAEIRGATCYECQYCLVGTPIDTLSDGTESVRCPECGTRHAIDDQYFSQVDINPVTTGLSSPTHEGD